MKHQILYLFISLFFLSCSKDFSEINSNPNSPVDVQPEFLLRQVIWDYGEQMSYEGFVAGNLLGQYFTAIDFNLFDRHSLTEPQFGGNPWPIIYSNLRDNEILLDKSLEDPSAAVYEGPSRIMKAYMTAALTDLYGDIPYFEALNGKEGVSNPSYDLQEDVYLANDGILDNLHKAIEAIDAYEDLNTLEGDILYDGDLGKWRKFANSLLLKSLMRISAVRNVEDQIQDLVSENDFILVNDDNAAFDFSNTQPNNFRMANLREGDFNLFIMSATAKVTFDELNDPRVGVFYRHPANFDNQYIGILNGPDPSQLSISIADLSLTGTVFRENTADLDANFLTAWEVHFLLAEAGLKGFVSADSKQMYEEGISLAFEYWNTEIPNDYLTQETIQLSEDQNEALKQIITQKWIANTVNGYESWIEFRRTGFPELRTISASLNNNLIPVRMPYPTDEAALNAENYQPAFQATEGNSINSKVWWDL